MKSENKGCLQSIPIVGVKLSRYLSRRTQRREMFVIPQENTFATSLNPRESMIFESTTQTRPTNKYNLLIEQVRNAALQRFVGEHSLSQLQNDHINLSFFEQALVVQMDGYFDSNREQFTDVMTHEGQIFLNRLLAITVANNGNSFSIGEMFTILQKGISNQILYPRSETRELLKNDLEAILGLVTNGNLASYEKDPLALRSDDAIALKRITDDLHVQFMFDIACGTLCVSQGYEQARQMVKDIAFAYQFRDDVLDFGLDMRDGVVNMLTSFAIEKRELDRLLEELQTNGNFSPKVLGFKNYYKRISELAPQSYNAMVTKQKEVLDGINMPEIATLLTLQSVGETKI